MDSMSNKSASALEELATKIGGEVKEDGKVLYYGPFEHQIFIEIEDDGRISLASEHPLYEIKKGKARRVRAGTNGDDIGWYYAIVTQEQLPAALDLALGMSDAKIRSVDFAYENILRDYCAHRLSVIEQGLLLYNKDDRSGIEFPAGGRFIDILAVDPSGGFVVFELKLSRGHERVVGQLLGYMGWVRQNLATSGQKVRGIIIASQITNDLRLATAGQANITLMEYKLDIQLKLV